jgi:hypothetical protein
MLGFAPLGVDPLGGFPSSPITLESTGGGAAKFPAPFLQIKHDMSKYHKRWFQNWLRRYEQGAVALEDVQDWDSPPLTQLLNKQRKN